MLKKVITYTNPFTEEQVSEEHYFHISKADLVEMEMEEHKDVYEKDGETLTGMKAKLQRIIDSEDGKAILVEIKDMIRRSYGKKEGERFVKSPELWAEFSSSEAFSQLIFDLCTDAQQASGFINGIVPKNMDQIAAEVGERAAKVESPRSAETQALIDAEKERVLAAGKPESDPTGLTNGITPRVLTSAEVAEMDADELKSGLATGRYKLS